jgi:diguanylate cyclase (GGDEF)-like protein
LLAFLLVVCVSASHLEGVLSPALTPFAQLAIFQAVAILLIGFTLRRGLAYSSYLAHTDELTSLNNRRSFMEKLGEVNDARHRGEASALFLLDMDRFKLVNDALGHPAGDDLLRVVAMRLRDSVPSGSFTARLGGDEFAVIAGVRGTREALLIAEDILDGLNRPVSIKGHEIWPNASIGIAMPGATRVPAGELLSMADVALYQAKGRGKGRAFLFDSNAHLPSVTKLSMESELHFALKHDQFEMLYQPIVGLSDRRITGAEALLRWNHPTQGVLTPDAFFALADETGISHSLSRWIVGEVSAQSRAWEHLFGDRIGVSMNVSAKEFQTIDFMETLGRLAQEQEAPFRGLNFELAERTLAEDDATTRTNLAEVRKMGFRVSIDDFGIGFSSLSYLQANRVDVLKLDPAFVRSEGNDGRTLRIVRSIVDLAHSLDMTVVAEGVETQEQYERMLKAGCDSGQGYYFAHPMNAHDFTELLAGSDVRLPVQQIEERRRRRAWSRRSKALEPRWPDDLQDRLGA